MMTKRGVLTRLVDDSKETLGHLQLFEGLSALFSCATLELPWLDNKNKISCIPAGRYTVVRRVSPTKGECFHLLDVAGREWVLIHSGNYAGSRNPKTGTPDTLGCILVGSGFAYVDRDQILDVTSSKPTLTRLLAEMPDKWVLDIVDITR